MRRASFFLVLLAALLILPAVHAGDIDSTGLVIKWNMKPSSCSQSSCNDTSGNGINITVVNVNAVYNSSDYSYRINGSPADLQSPYNAKENISTNFTAYAWFYSYNNSGTLIGRASGTFEWTIAVNNGMNPSVGVWNGTDNNTQCAHTNGCYTVGHYVIENTWNMVALRYIQNSSTQGTVQLFINGARLGIDETVVGGMKGSGAGIRYGSGSGGNYYNGSIGEFRLYNRSLSNAEIASLAAFGRTSNLDTANVTVNFSQSLGTVRNEFYGTNDEDGWCANDTFIDSNGDHNFDKYADSAYDCMMLDAANMRGLRVEMTLDQLWNANNNTFKTTNNTNRGNILNREEIVQRAFTHNQTVNFIGGGMPGTMGSTNTSLCTANSSTCPAQNVSDYANLTELFFDNVSPAGIYDTAIKYSLGNEMNLQSSWLNAIPRGSGAANTTIRITEALKMANAVYDRVHPSHPNIQFCLPDVTMFLSQTEDSWTWEDQVIANLTGKYQNCQDFHTYRTNANDLGFDNISKTMYANMTATAAKYNAPVTQFIISEFGTQNANFTVNNTQGNVMQYGLMYTTWLNLAPNLTTLEPYDAHDWNPYNDTSRDGWPTRWDLWFSPNLGNTNQSTYLTAQRFGIYHAPGSTVQNTSPNHPAIASVCTNTNGRKYCTITNQYNISVNTTIYPSGMTNPLYLTDVNTGTNYTYNASSGGFASITLFSTNVSTFELVDNLTPIVSNITTTTTLTTATITWTTSTASNTTLASGTTLALGNITVDPAFVSQHSITLTNLTPGTLLLFNITSTNVAGQQTTNGTFNLTTKYLPSNVSLWISGAGSTATILNLNLTAPGYVSVQYGYNLNLTSGNATNNSQLNFSTVNIPNLTSSTTVFANITVCNQDNNCSPAINLSFTTTSSQNLVSITSNATTNVSQILLAPTGTILPANPLLSFPDGSSVNPSFVYDNASFLLTFNASLPPGVSNLTVDSVTPLLENASTSLGLSMTSGQTITFKVDAADNGPNPNLQSVGLNITQNGGVVQVIPLSFLSGNTYQSASTILSLAAGTYNLSFWDNDTAGNMNYTSLSLLVLPTGTASFSGGGGCSNCLPTPTVTILNASTNATVPSPVVVPPGPSFVDFGAARVQANSIVTFLKDQNFPLFAMILGVGFILFILVKW